MLLRNAYSHATRTPRGFHMFNVMACEVCGTDCEAPNTWNAPHNAYLSGIAMLDAALAEIGACDALGGIAVCPDCYVSDDDTDTDDYHEDAYLAGLEDERAAELADDDDDLPAELGGAPVFNKPTITTIEAATSEGKGIILTPADIDTDDDDTAALIADHLAKGGNRATLKAAARWLDIAPRSDIRVMKRPELVKALSALPRFSVVAALTA